MIRILTSIALILVVLFGAAPVRGQHHTSKWEFEVAPYAWIPGGYGTVGIRRRTVNVDVSPNDVLNALWRGDTFAAGGYFSVRYERFSLFADSFGGFAKGDTDATLSTRFCDLQFDANYKGTFAFTDFGVGYRVASLPLPQRHRPMTIGVYAGARYMYLDNEVRASARVVGASPRQTNVSATLDWADPLLGIRFDVPLLARVSATFRADIGGFGASSDLTWNIVSGFRYWTEWSPRSARPYVAIGYRVLAVDRSAGDRDVDLQFRGPMAGMGLVF